MKWPFAKEAINKEDCFVVGEDRQFVEKALVSTGAFFMDRDNNFAYLTIPQTMGARTKFPAKGKRINSGQINLVFETSAQPYDFKNNEWVKKDINVAQILKDGLNEGFGATSRQIEDDKRMTWMMPLLWAVFAILAMVVVLVFIVTLV